MRAKIYNEKCIGCSYCVSFAPHIIAMNERTGKVFFIETQKDDFEIIFPEDEFVMRELEDVCAVGAIKTLKK